jgi:hypothetical protein
LVSEEAPAKRKAEREIPEAESRAAREKPETEQNQQRPQKFFVLVLLNLCYDEYGIVFDAHVGQGARWLGCELGLAEDDYFSRYCAS